MQVESVIHTHVLSITREFNRGQPSGVRRTPDIYTRKMKYCNYAFEKLSCNYTFQKFSSSMG